MLKIYRETCKKDVKSWCTSFTVFNSKAGLSDKGLEEVMIYNADLPFKIIPTNILGFFSVSTLVNKYFLTVVDRSTK